MTGAAWTGSPSSGIRDINYRAVEGALDDVGLMEGPDALRDHLRQWEETFEKGRMEVEELIDAGGPGRRPRTRHRADEGERGRVDLRYAIVFTIRDGKIAAGREYFTREEALEAAGLEE